MSHKKALNLIMTLLFILVISFAYLLNQAKAQENNEFETQTGIGAPQNELVRAADIFKVDTATTAWGGTRTQFEDAPDVGWGEVIKGYSYTDPLTGSSVSYQVTGYGMGAVPVPVYGGIGSQFGSSSYGPLSTGQAPQVRPTPGIATQTSTGGSAFGQGYQFETSQPDPYAIITQSLLQDPTTAGLGYALAYQSGAFSGFGLQPTIGGTGTFGGLSGFGRLGGLSDFGGFGGVSGFSGVRPSYTSGGYSPGYSYYPGGYATGGYGYPAAIPTGQPSYPGAYGYPSVQQPYPYGGGVTRLPYTTGTPGSPPPSSQTPSTQPSASSDQPQDDCIIVGGVRYCPEGNN